MASERHFGIDLSTWNTGCDYEAAKLADGVEFAILRCGFGQKPANRDNEFDTHLAGCQAAGLPVGAYQYSYATDSAGAKAEAAACAGWLEGVELQLPVFLDMEEASVKKLGRKRVTAIAKAWIAAMKAAGFEAVGVYSSPAWFDTVLDAQAVVDAGGVIWCASWATQAPSYPGLVCWQFGGEINKLGDRAVYGIGSVVDQDFWFGPLPQAAEEEESMTVICTKQTPTLDQTGRKEAGRYVDAGDICEIRLAVGPLVEVDYPTPSGTRTAYVKSLANFKMA